MFKPYATPPGEVRWLRGLCNPQHALIKCPRLIFFTRWHGELDMINSIDSHSLNYLLAQTYEAKTSDDLNDLRAAFRIHLGAFCFAAMARSGQRSGCGERHQECRHCCQQRPGYEGDCEQSQISSARYERANGRCRSK